VSVRRTLLHGCLRNPNSSNSAAVQSLPHILQGQIKADPMRDLLTFPEDDWLIKVNEAPLHISSPGSTQFLARLNFS
jgi:hypothetical protein